MEDLKTNESLLGLQVFANEYLDPVICRELQRGTLIKNMNTR
jgi:hypothetical protein